MEFWRVKLLKQSSVMHWPHTHTARVDHRTFPEQPCVQRWQKLSIFSYIELEECTAVWGLLCLKLLELVAHVGPISSQDPWEVKHMLEFMSRMSWRVFMNQRLQTIPTMFNRILELIWHWNRYSMNMHSEYAVKICARALFLKHVRWSIESMWSFCTL